MADTWVHAFEQDGPAGEVYVREESPIPLSRRPREQVRLSPGGSARVFVPGPDDRLIEQQASWVEEGGHMVIRVPAARLELVVVERSDSRLVIRRRQPADIR